MQNKKNIVIMGVGNILLRDEGVGICVLKELEALYDFPNNVKLVDGGVLGLSLTGTLMEADFVIIIDAVRGGNDPGTLYRFFWNSKPSDIKYKDSLHQIDLAETMSTLSLINKVPKVLVVGVEYENIFEWGTSLTPKVKKAIPELIKIVKLELKKINIILQKKIYPQKVCDVLSNSSYSNKN